MKIVVVESPYQAETPELLRRSIDYARACVLDCIIREEAPIASHLFYTQKGVLDDKDLEERKLGIEAGLAWLNIANAQVFYVDLGWSAGMLAALEAKPVQLPIVIRRLGGMWKQSK